MTRASTRRWDSSVIASRTETSSGEENRVVSTYRSGSQPACTALEVLLNDALTVMPALIAQTIEQVTT